MYAKQPITTTVDKQLAAQAVRANIKWHVALERGIRSMLKKEDVFAEMSELRTGNAKLHATLTRFSERIFSLQQQVDELKTAKKDPFSEEMTKKIEVHR